MTFGRRGAMGAALAALVVRPGSLRAGSTTHEVVIEKFRFVPEELEVRIGDRVRWINRDIAPHTATAVTKDWNSGRLKKGEIAELEVQAGMSEDYFCLYHPKMKAVLRVVG